MPAVQKIHTGHRHRKYQDVASEENGEGVPIVKLVDETVWVVGRRPRA